MAFRADDVKPSCFQDFIVPLLPGSTYRRFVVTLFNFL
jgi:hypothetical protein